MFVRAFILVFWLALFSPNSEAARWQVHPEHSALSFEVEISGATARGQFADWSAIIVYDEQAPEAGSVFVEVQVASANIDRADAQSAILRPSWLDAAAYPVAVFEGQGFSILEDDRFLLHGNLTIRDTIRPIELTGRITINGDTAFADATADISRLDFGVGSASDPVSLNVLVKTKIVATRIME